MLCLTVLFSFAICTTIYGAISIIGYLMFGDKMLSQITFNLLKDSFAAKVARYTIFLCSFCFVYKNAPFFICIWGGWIRRQMFKWIIRIRGDCSCLGNLWWIWSLGLHTHNLLYVWIFCWIGHCIFRDFMQHPNMVSVMLKLFLLLQFGNFKFMLTIALMFHFIISFCVACFGCPLISWHGDLWRLWMIKMCED